jgi:hypothetical protein
MEQMLCKTGRVSGNVSIVFPQSSTSSNSWHSAISGGSPVMFVCFKFSFCRLKTLGL